MEKEKETFKLTDNEVKLVKCVENFLNENKDQRLTSTLIQGFSVDFYKIMREIGTHEEEKKS